MKEKPAYFLLELVPTLSVVVVLLVIVILALNPQKQFREARNERRRADVALIADAIVEYTRDEGDALLRSIPLSPAAAIEICGDAQTGNCAGLLDLGSLVGAYLDSVPVDPNVSDPANFNKNSRYFLVRPSAGRVTVFAEDTEPAGEQNIAVTR